MKCPVCGENLKDGTNFCRLCGAKLADFKPVENDLPPPPKHVPYVEPKKIGPITPPIIRCPNCDYVGEGRVRVYGSMLIEIILWMFLVIPGLIYSIWRMSNTRIICSQCEFQNVVTERGGGAYYLVFHSWYSTVLSYVLLLALLIYVITKFSNPGL